jgi:hypothetical protein
MLSIVLMCGCTTASPTSPNVLDAGSKASPASPTALDTSSKASPAAKFAGEYVLTIEIDQTCQFAEASRVWPFSAVLKEKEYLDLEVVGGGFEEPAVVGQLYWGADSRFFIVININYEEAQHYPRSPQLLIYGAGHATALDSTIVGAIPGEVSITGNETKSRCAGSHRLTLVRQTK